jgi:hypothetical protein
MAQGYLIFHLNLAFSSINTEARPDVICKCYWPLLELAESTGIPVGIELTGWTLQQIALLDRSWVDRFQQMLAAGKCELIGSGWSQIIGPLVPYEVNRWNQKLGLDAYQQFLGVRPRIALVNEMAFSTSMVDLYADAGYDGIIMDRDNVRLALGLDHTSLSTTPTHASGCGDRSLPVLWSDSILFQRLQRVVHGDIPVSEYLGYVKQRGEQDGALLPIYCNDVEIFDYRPGRFTAESRMHPEGEWERLMRVCKHLKDDIALDWLSPSQALDKNVATIRQNVARLTSVSHPIPVKKQAKYNINRWAVTGRDNLWLNTACHQMHRLLMQKEEASDEESWRELCELWASDLRTHITDNRWVEACLCIDKVLSQLGQPKILFQTGDKFEGFRAFTEDTLPLNIQIQQDAEGILWTIKTQYIHLVLNVRRGMAIKSLSFKSHNFEPVLGTLQQGYFSSIEYGADFYSGGVIIEVPGDHSRMTDLEWVTPQIRMQGSTVTISAMVTLTHGFLRKTIVIDAETENIRLSYDFQQFERPLGIVRAGILTLIPESFSSPFSVGCLNGGKEMEWFKLDQNFNHGQAASTLVSSSSGFGATDGCLIIKDVTSRQLVAKWNPSECAVVPILKHQQMNGYHLTRLSFSLCELDDTTHKGGRLLPFSVELSVD